jgi:hypothetical protein
LPAPVLAVRSVDLDDPDAGRGDIASQARAVTPGPLDPGQRDGPESAQPVKQAGIPGRGDQEFFYAEQPADGVKRGGDVRAGVGDPRRQ